MLYSTWNRPRPPAPAPQPPIDSPLGLRGGVAAQQRNPDRLRNRDGPEDDERDSKRLRVSCLDDSGASAEEESPTLAVPPVVKRRITGKPPPTGMV